MPSPEHQALRARISELSTRFVDFDIPLDRDPNSHELDMIASFKLLAHAEFETFIEGRVRDTIRRSLTAWKENQKVTRALIGLLLRWYPHFERDQNPFANPQTLQRATELFERISVKAEKEIQDNHGLKKKLFRVYAIR